MKVIAYSFYLILLVFINSHNATCQINNSDSIFLLSATNKLSQKYTTAIDNDAHIYNGKEYLNYDKYYMKGHQFLNPVKKRKALYFMKVTYLQKYL
ncbi:hypothetical protein AHMF7616_03748 [Adhaeribacter pallidiroseus]|uniref:Uncharacterized protein n=1 Tax=Adhaeribacter pallidiroseus TaxID=2072847 RepID=A0A369QSH2_9BACT|nr:hypothetical protein AHMF7616_03748 [Adhaeribacter pallidiroseus]